MSSSEPECGDTGRRAFARLQVGFGARFRTLHGAQPVRLIDLSQGGAQMILSRPDEAGAGLLTWLDYETYADLAWREGDTIGVTFDPVLPAGWLAQTRLQAPSVVRDEEMGVSITRAWVAGEISDN
jgi:hypothetical protein